MTEYQFIVKARAQRRIRLFYQNVARKYKHTYDIDDFIRDVQNAVYGIYQIEKTLLRREPTLKRWAGYHMDPQFCRFYRVATKRTVPLPH